MFLRVVSHEPKHITGSDFPLHVSTDHGRFRDRIVDGWGEAGMMMGDQALRQAAESCDRRVS
jgi:hypothetical protein